jgi:hypothetical protein
MTNFTMAPVETNLCYLIMKHVTELLKVSACNFSVNLNSVYSSASWQHCADVTSQVDTLRLWEYVMVKALRSVLCKSPSV